MPLAGNPHITTTSLLKDDSFDAMLLRVFKMERNSITQSQRPSKSNKDLSKATPNTDEAAAAPPDPKPPQNTINTLDVLMPALQVSISTSDIKDQQPLSDKELDKINFEKLEKEIDVLLIYTKAVRWPTFSQSVTEGRFILRVCQLIVGLGLRCI